MYKSCRIESRRTKGRIIGTVHEIIWASHTWQCTSNTVCSILWVSDYVMGFATIVLSLAFLGSTVCASILGFDTPLQIICYCCGLFLLYLLLFLVAWDIYRLLGHSWLLGIYIGYLVILSYNWFWFWVGSGTLGSVAWWYGRQIYSISVGLVIAGICLLIAIVSL